MYLQLYHKHLHSMLPSYNLDVGDTRKKGGNEMPGGLSIRANVQIGRGGFLPPPPRRSGGASVGWSAGGALFPADHPLNPEGSFTTEAGSTPVMGAGWPGPDSTCRSGQDREFWYNMSQTGGGCR